MVATFAALDTRRRLYIKAWKKELGRTGSIDSAFSESNERGSDFKIGNSRATRYLATPAKRIVG
jgi:hypothetical protein